VGVLGLSCQQAKEYLEQFEAAQKKLAARNTPGRHWTEKELSEMRERDWHIF
jgi:cell fate (sporulation/competence/biofilm development) regulator YlbF (YheA/YmcA/DUF963 family)